MLAGLTTLLLFQCAGEVFVRALTIRWLSHGERGGRDGNVAGSS